MPTWSGILQELATCQPPEGTSQFDFIRRKYLVNLHRKTGRNIILYATNWTQSHIDPSLITITEEDIQGLMEVIHGLNGSSLDLIIHSPGGSPDATSAFVSYLRSKFSNIRVIIPQAAMSAASMLACAADSIVMGKHSFLGPIDPQMILQTQMGLRSIPARAILDQFEMAKNECQTPEKVYPWMPILSQYGPALLIECQNAIDSSKNLASLWLSQYMFKDNTKVNGVNEQAQKIGNFLGEHKNFKSHSYHIGREEAKGIGLKIEDLETDQEFQDIVLSIFHATTHTFANTAAVKIIENHNGKAYMKLNIQPQLPQPIQSQQPQQQPQK